MKARGLTPAEISRLLEAREKYLREIPSLIQQYKGLVAKDKAGLGSGTKTELADLALGIKTYGVAEWAKAARVSEFYRRPLP